VKALTLQELLAMASSHGASDLLLQEGKAPVLRINGQLHTLETDPITGEQLGQLWVMCGASESANDHDASLATEAGQRFRANLHRRLGERGAVLRHIRTQIPTMDELGVPADLLRDWGARTSGMVIVTGPTGSGKSTTLAALIEHINSTAARHIVTIEDPIEYVFTPDRSVITQREVGLDTASFAEGLRRSLRQDPDVILVGEVRDRESAVTALQAAETGHLVLATLHASACAEAAERMEFLFSAGERDGVRRLLSSVLIGVLCQRLVPSLDTDRRVACEFFSNAAFSRKLVREGRWNELQDLIHRGGDEATSSLTSSLLSLFHNGAISEETALAFAPNPADMGRLIRGVTSAVQSTRQ
jgi:twitching motility protein PilT